MPTTQLRRGHLQLVRKPGQSIRILVAGVEVWVKVDRIEHGRVILRFEAPEQVNIAREELLR